MNKKLLVGVAGVAILVIGAGAMLLGGGANATPGKYTYETVKIDKGDVARVVTASGAVNPREKVEVGSEVSGKITAIYVDFNDRVKKNQVLAQVDPETFQNTLDQNRARLQPVGGDGRQHPRLDRARQARTSKSRPRLMSAPRFSTPKAPPPRRRWNRPSRRSRIPSCRSDNRGSLAEVRACRLRDGARDRAGLASLQVWSAPRSARPSTA